MKVGMDSPVAVSYYYDEREFSGCRFGYDFERYVLRQHAEEGKRLLAWKHINGNVFGFYFEVVTSLHHHSYREIVLEMNTNNKSWTDFASHIEVKPWSMHLITSEESGLRPIQIGSTFTHLRMVMDYLNIFEVGDQVELFNMHDGSLKALCEVTELKKVRIKDITPSDLANMQAIYTDNRFKNLSSVTQFMSQAYGWDIGIDEPAVLITLRAIEVPTEAQKSEQSEKLLDRIKTAIKYVRGA